ncbi:MAG: lactate utilization protein [Deltaproteobacteria bacterium]|jgi:L-lactate dehydrogenase complex protein LldG|nr:lactate utilization protein [Deltaproteobacteria bacterium]
MSTINTAAVDLFVAKAKPVTIQIKEVSSLSEALTLTLEICEQKPLGKLMLPVKDPDAPRKKTLAAPALAAESWDYLVKEGEKKGFEMIRDNLRQYLAGIDVAFSVATMGIADTATSVLESLSEDERLATMICETHVVALPKSKIVSDSYEAESYLRASMTKDRNFIAFVSGPSRTADIERVLTLGVHGPLELFVALINE